MIPSFEIKIIKDNISKSELKVLAAAIFGDMVKGVVDIEKEVLALGGELHADSEAVLLDCGSKQQNLWGINIYPSLLRSEWIEFDSMINIRPAQNNRSRNVENEEIRNKIIEVVHKLIEVNDT